MTLDLARLLALCAVVLPVAAHGAPPPGPPKRIGVLRFFAAPDTNFVTPFLARLKALGYEPGQNVHIEWRFANGSVEEAHRHARELVALDVDVINAGITPAALAAKAATATIPIVMQSGDAVGVGLVASLARPGGNITGTTAQAAELIAKAVEALHDIAPSVQTIGAFEYRGDAFAARFIAEAERGARTVGLQFRALPIDGPQDLDRAFAQAKAAGIGALLIPGSLRGQNADVARLGLTHGIAVVGENDTLVRAGGLVSVGYDLTSFAARAADFVDKILNGAKPAELPVEQPTRILLVVNAATAKALGLALPQSILIRANEVIE